MKTESRTLYAVRSTLKNKTQNAKSITETEKSKMRHKTTSRTREGKRARHSFSVGGSYLRKSHRDFLRSSAQGLPSVAGLPRFIELRGTRV